MGDLKSAFAPQHDVIWFATKGKFKFPGNRPKSVISIQRIAGEKLVHPNEKPVALMEQLISAITPQGGTILDPFMGSGSTGVAATKLGFKFIGCEMNSEYVEIAKKRIEAASNQASHLPLERACQP
jgi:site-specific DNA-methyltransferase (adenine-specific)